MRYTRSISFITSICLSLFAHVAWGQDIAPEAHIRWGASGGMNHYEEPDLMQLKGPELGIHARVTDWAEMPHTQFEGDFLFGRQKYTSVSSGNLSGVTNIETRWRALAPVFSDTPTNEGFFAGLALHTLWNDLRGTSTFNGKTYGGYQRSAAQLWLPLRWASGDVWQLDAGLLIYGRHASKLSEVNRSYSDIVNTQRRGHYAQVSMNVDLPKGDVIKPFIRYTHLADSNTVAMGGFYWLEPESERWQIGAVWEFSAP